MQLHCRAARVAGFAVAIGVLPLATGLAAALPLALAALLVSACSSSPAPRPIRIARKHGDGLVPMRIVHIQALCTPGGLPCAALAIFGIADGDQIATPVEALKHQFVESGGHAAEIEYR